MTLQTIVATPTVGITHYKPTINKLNERKIINSQDTLAHHSQILIVVIEETN